MRRVWLCREDFSLFHQDITPEEYEFFKSHAGAFKRMWNEQTRRFWSLFVNTFEHFLWNYGIMKDFPMTADEAREYIDEIIFYIRDQFVDGRTSTAKALVTDCVVVTQNRHCIAQLDKAVYAQNPFFMKETREAFRQLFGPPSDKRTFMKVLCGIQVYVKFAGAAVACLRRWLSADNIPPDEELEEQFLDNVHSQSKFDKVSPGYEAAVEAAVKAAGKSETQSTAKTTTAVKKTAKQSVEVKNSENSVTTTTGEDKKTKGEREAGAGKRKQKKKKKASSENKSVETPSTVKGEKCNEESDVKVVPGDGQAEVVGEKGLEVGDCQNGVFDKDRDGGGKDDGDMSQLESGSDVSSSSCLSPSSITDSGIGSVAGDEPVARDDQCIVSQADCDLDPVTVEEELAGIDTSSVAKDVSTVAKEVDAKKRKLHSCACCGCGETMPKSFKRCQKCRGSTTPKYYCSRECQVKHWKEHKLDHKDDSGTETAAT